MVKRKLMSHQKQTHYYSPMAGTNNNMMQLVIVVHKKIQVSYKCWAHGIPRMNHLWKSSHA